MDFLASLGFHVLLVLVTAGAFVLGFKMWVSAQQQKWLNSVDWVLYEIRVPRDIFKSPLAMEIFFISALTQTGGVGTWHKKFWEGRVLNWFSLEMASLGGQVKFFIRTNKAFKDIVQAQFYAQYPQVELVEVEDYVNKTFAKMYKEEWRVHGAEFTLKDDDFVPIKTYVDYGLDKASDTLDPEQMIDPLTPVIEFLGSLGEGEECWIQILVRSADHDTANRYKKKGHWFKKHSWRDEAKEKLKELKEKLEKKGADGERIYALEADKDKLRAIEKNISKPGFDCGIRVVYLGTKEKFNGLRISAYLGIFKQFNTTNLNRFVPQNVTDFDYPWEDPFGWRGARMKRELVEAYALRSYFYPPYNEDRKIFVLNSEELATIFHIPGRVSETPTLERIESKKSEPPSNLPF